MEPDPGNHSKRVLPDFARPAFPRVAVRSSSSPVDILFGYAVNLDVENARMAWMDMDHTPESRESRCSIPGLSLFPDSSPAARRHKVQDLMDHGRVQAVVRVLPGFSRDLKRGNTASVQILVDGTNSNTASIISSYAGQVVARYTSKTMATQLNSKLMPGSVMIGGAVPFVIPVLTAQYRVWFNPDPEKPRLLCSRSHREYHCAGHCNADRDEHRAGEGNRDNGATDGDTDKTAGVDYGKLLPFAIVGISRWRLWWLQPC